MAKEYIEREDTLKGLEDSNIGFCDDEPIQTRNSALKIIQNIPAADVAPVRHGKWKLNKDGSGTCSECGRVQTSCWDLDDWDNYCHHCGADMREVQHDD